MLNPTLSSYTRSPFIVCGVTFTLLVSLMGLFSPLIGPYNPIDQELRLRHVPPLSSGTVTDRAQDPPAERERLFILGTDHLGRDVLSRLISSFKVSAYTGLLAWGLGTGLAWLLIALQGGPARAAASAPTRSFPLAVLNSSALVMAGLILGVGHLLMWSYVRVWAYISRTYEIELFLFSMLLYAGILSAFIPASLLYQSLRQAPSGEASSPPQVGNRRWLMVRQALLLAPVSVSLAVLISIFIDYPWSFLGFGVQPPEASLGLMLAQGRQYLIAAWWVFYIPLIVMVIAIGAFLAIAVPLSRRQNRAFHPAPYGGRAQLSGGVAPNLDRVGAFLIDLILLWLLKTIVPVLLGFLLFGLIWINQGPWLINPISQVVVYVLLVAYFPFFWAASGQTPGMRVFGIQVVRTNGNPVSVPRAALRLAGLAVSIAVLFLGLIWALLDARRQGWHDKIADTRVAGVEAADLEHSPA